ncbi:hypothetical protein FEM48_Zijuj07G0152000 [Ziziphus jujuba var. spinosa]|uniref:Uncharacterized protein n=1 Tax=Ziziphus jujuba var. spinosa TaxID=714518 RepID=A0A978V5D1_ZIZJJ|nr:hypothetical protein FEM48_Zijuj07G0152000 [Ziziphus jujuba var. spinosa]
MRWKHWMYLSIISKEQISPTGWQLKGTYTTLLSLLTKFRIPFLSGLGTLPLTCIILNLSGNKLTGKLPGETSILSGLIALDLSRNDLSGEIPKNIGKMIYLESLDLSENLFSGGIPMSLSNLTLLKHLNLSFNFLSGRIPSSAILQSFSADPYTGKHGLDTSWK